MASAVVNDLLKKLDDVLFKEIVFLCFVGKKMEAMKRELERIRSCLKAADAKRNMNDGAKKWVHDVRQAAFKIEAAIDTFMADVANIDHEEPNNNCLCICINIMFQKFAKLPALHKLGTELDEIKSLIDEISKSRSTYDISHLGEGSSQVRRPVRPLIIPEIYDPEIVGFQADRRVITERLLNETITKRSVISIVGQGGLGKTTLALKVYNSLEVKKNFPIQIWSSISQEFQLENLLRIMLKKIQPTITHEMLDKLNKKELFIELNKSLREKKYLIVMDDVWTTDLWDQIKQAFPDLKNGSRILITTRFVNVGKKADSTSHEPYKLPFLNEEDSLELFIKNGIPGKECPIGLRELAKHFTQKCGGLPLALEILGKFLSIKSLTYDDWNRIFKQMDWKTVGENCVNVIAMSYEDLSHVLKTCFKYFALYPEDYRIEVKSLIRIWVAEEFISEEENQTMEETAEGYLEELVERSMVQVAKRNYNGSIKYCHIHDLLRVVAIQKAKEDDFLRVFSNPNNLTGSATVRHAAFHYPLSDESVEATNSHLHSLFCFEFDSVQNFSKFRLLRTFNQFKPGMHTFNADFGEMTQLRYFRLNSFSLFHLNIKFMDHNKNLQTIEFKQIKTIEFRRSHGEIPIEFIRSSLWDVETLRHVTLFSHYSPSPPTNLPNLQTLYKLIVKKSWEGRLPHLPNIREIEIDTREVDVEYGSRVVADFVTRSEYLVHLTIDSGYFNLFEMKVVPRYEHIEVLIIYGSLSLGMLTFDVSLFPVHLIELCLYNSRLVEDPMSILGKLNNLKKLKICDVYGGHKMTCSAGDFCQLKKLVIDRCHVREWKIEKGALPNLINLKLIYCDYLEPHGLDHVITVKEFTWKWHSRLLSEEERLRRTKEIWNQIKHVPSIKFLK